MSNMTDGKNALRAGDFDAAERKLLKALDRHPDDGELWWAMMLCRARCRNDEELERSLVDAFSAAAERGEAMPETPFSSPYCKNALKYSRTDAHRRFVDRVVSELNAAFGAAARVRPPKQKRPTKRRPALKYSAIAYCSAAAALAGGSMLVGGLLRARPPFIWAGISVFAVFALAAGLSVRAAKKRGTPVKCGVGMLAGLFALVCVGLLASGVATANTTVMIVSGVMLGLVAVWYFFTSFGSREKPEQSERRSGRPDYGKYDKIEASAGKTRKERNNEYSDTFD